MPLNTARIAFSAILFLLLSANGTVAQSNSGGGNGEGEHTLWFDYGNYDVISNIYVFLTSGPPIHKLQVSSIELESGGNGEDPEPVDIDLLFRTAIAEAIVKGYIVQPEGGNSVELSATIDGEIAGILFIPESPCGETSCEWHYRITWPLGSGTPVITLIGTGPGIL